MGFWLVSSGRPLFLLLNFLILDTSICGTKDQIVICHRIILAPSTRYNSFEWCKIRPAPVAVLFCYIVNCSHANCRPSGCGVADLYTDAARQHLKSWIIVCNYAKTTIRSTKINSLGPNAKAIIYYVSSFLLWYTAHGYAMFWLKSYTCNLVLSLSQSTCVIYPSCWIILMSTLLWAQYRNWIAKIIF